MEHLDEFDVCYKHAKRVYESLSKLDLIQRGMVLGLVSAMIDYEFERRDEDDFEEGEDWKHGHEKNLN